MCNLPVEVAFPEVERAASFQECLMTAKSPSPKPLPQPQNKMTTHEFEKGIQ